MKYQISTDNNRVKKSKSLKNDSKNIKKNKNSDDKEVNVGVRIDTKIINDNDYKDS